MHKKWVVNSLLVISIGLFSCLLIYFVRLAMWPEPDQTPTPSKSALNAFNAPETLVVKLSDNGIGPIESWKAYDEGIYLASSSYFQVAAPGKNAISNQLSYSLVGDNKNYLNYIEIVLILNNKNTMDETLNLLSAVAIETFKDIQLTVPDGLLNAIAIPRKFSYDSANFHIKLFEKWNGLTEWHLILLADPVSL